ncbi:MAG: histidine--tRNA ligase [Erysipelotrichaceae bacterium]|nr:histidine--tRNA ligase [Erysipelotrichaceae bacterium]
MSYQVPRGTQDILPDQIHKWHALEDLIRQFCYVYDYKEIRTPIFEHTNVFKRGNDASDMVNKEMYTFTLENSSTSLTLRPEMTAGVVRSYVEHKLYGEADQPLKMYYVGPMCRHERPQKGRSRIFHQFGVEVIGAKHPLLDVETIALGWSFVSALGLKDMKVLINTLGDDASRDAYRAALKQHFAKDIDHMCADCKRRYEQNPLRILDCKVDKESAIMKTAPKMKDYLNEESKAYFEQVLAGLDALGIPYEIDDQLVRGLDYYTHTVFEVVSLNKEMGAQSTVFAGGRYDGMVKYFGGPQMSGIGWALGMERLILACEAEGIALGETESLDIYVLCLSPSVSVQALQIVSACRAAGYKSDMDYQERSFKAQFKTVDRKGVKAVILLGEDEVKANMVTIKRIADQKQVQVKQEEMISCLDGLFQEETTYDCEEGNCTCHHEE